MEDNKVYTNLQGFSEFKVSVRSLQKTEPEDLSNFLASLAIVDDYILPNINIPNYKLEKFDTVILNSTLVKAINALQLASNTSYEISSKLATRPWAIILSTNQPIEQAENEDYTKEILKENTFLESVKKIWAMQAENELNIQQAVLQTLNTFLDKIVAKNLDNFNESFSQGVSNVLKFNKAVEKYTGSNALSVSNNAIASFGSGISSGVAQISTAMRSSNSELAASLNPGVARLKGSILDPIYLQSVQKTRSTEPVKPTGETFLMADALGRYGPTFYPGKYSVNGLSYKESNALPGRSTITHNYKERLRTTTEKPSEKIVIDSKTGKVKTEHRFYKNQRVENSRTLHGMITALDAQMQYFIAYFSTVYEGKEKLLKLNTPDSTENTEYPYFYYFYTNNFNFQPVKKAMTDFNYGVYKTSAALDKTDTNSTFSFDLPLDIQLSFWQFVMKNGLGVNTASGIYSTKTFYEESSNRRINLNFIVPQAAGPLNPSETKDKLLTKNNYKVNQFVLENVYFTNVGALNFQQSFGQMKTSIKGIYKRLKWHHNKLLSSFEKS